MIKRWHVSFAIEPQDWLAKVRAATRPKVVAQKWSDEHIDRMIEEEREQVQQNLP